MTEWWVKWGVRKGKFEGYRLVEVGIYTDLTQAGKGWKEVWKW